MQTIEWLHTFPETCKHPWSTSARDEVHSAPQGKPIGTQPAAMKNQVLCCISASILFESCPVHKLKLERSLVKEKNLKDASQAFLSFFLIEKNASIRGRRISTLTRPLS